MHGRSWAPFGTDDMRIGAGTRNRRRVSTRRSSVPKVNSIVVRGSERSRIGGHSWQVPLWDRISIYVSAGMIVQYNLHDQLKHDNDPSQAIVPVEKVQIPSSRAYYATGAVFLEQSPESHRVFNNAGSSNGCGDDGEDGIG